MNSKKETKKEIKNRLPDVSREAELKGGKIMCCLLLILMFFGPRLAAITWWLARPSYFSLVFNGWLWPLLGIIFLPWATLAYAVVGLDGISTFEWFILIFAFLVDLAAYSGGAYHRQKSR